MQVIIKVENLYKYYNGIKAVNGISFEVYEGEIFGMVGPNGAGKTTTIECIEGLRKPDKGSINVLDLNPLKDGYTLRRKIGIQLQESSLHSRIKVKEAMELFSSFYSQPVSWKNLLEKFGLKDKLNIYYDNLSGGLKKRLQIALALIGEPIVIFFDEITTGLDPQARNNMWDLLREIRAQGKTVFLSTHYMEEAQELCDRVCIIDHGKIVALDKPDTLIKNLDAENKVVFSTAGQVNLKLLEDLSCVTKVKEVNDQTIVYGKGNTLLVAVVQAVESQGLSIKNLQIRQSTLEDIYLTLTGREYRD